MGSVYLWLDLVEMGQFVESGDFFTMDHQTVFQTFIKARWLSD